MRLLLVAVGVFVALSSSAFALDGEPVTFAEHVSPILARYCVQCHRPDGPAPFSLATYEDARAHATQIAVVTAGRVMPPWKADPQSGPFIGQEWPTQADVERLAQWAATGAAPGARRTEAATESGGPWRLGRPDLEIGLQEPYVLAADGTDVFRIFVIHVPGGAARFVSGLEFQPGNARVVHHANIRIDKTAASRALDASDPTPGYDGLLARSALFPDGHFLGWTPGQVAPQLPPGLAWRLDPDSDIVVQLHMRPNGRRELVNPRVGLFFTSDPPGRSPIMIRLGRQDLDIAEGEANYVETDRYTVPVDVEVQAVQPHAHYRARQIRGWATLPDGTERSLLTIDDWDFGWQHLYRYVTPFTLPKGSVLSMRYVYDNSAGNPRNPQQPPVRARWGQRSTEEMGDLWIQVLARDDRDWLTLNRDFRPKAIGEDLVGYESLLERTPNGAGLHDDAAVLALELGRAEVAVRHFRASLRTRPESAPAHFNLGTALTLAREPESAAEEFRTALRIKPDYAVAQNNLGNLAEAAGRFDEASVHYREALRIDPLQVEARSNLGSVLLRLGRPADAMPYLLEALKQRPEYANARNNLGTAFAAQGRIAEAIDSYRTAIASDPEHTQAHNNLGRMLLAGGSLEAAVQELEFAIQLDPVYAEAHYNLGVARQRQRDWLGAATEMRRAIELQPSWTTAVVDLAWILVTAPDARARAVSEAIALAERAVVSTNKRDPIALDVLGVAYAEAGRFDEAVQSATAALAAGAGDALAAEIATRLERYRQRLSYRPLP